MCHGNTGSTSTTYRAYCQCIWHLHHPLFVGSCQASHVQEAIGLSSPLCYVPWDVWFIGYTQQQFVQLSLVDFTWLNAVLNSCWHTQIFRCFGWCFCLHWLQCTPDPPPPACHFSAILFNLPSMCLMVGWNMCFTT